MKFWKIAIYSIIIGIILGFGVAWLIPGGFLLNAWFASAVLSTISFIALIWIWQHFGSSKLLGWMMALAFILRLGSGIAISLILPVHGYDTDPQKAGYIFYDAFRRDVESWGLVESGEKLWDVFWVGFDTDQYGGLLVSSTFIYRYLSPDIHRPFLILILTAAAMALGVAFLWKAVKNRWDPKLANLAGWIFVLYPDGILFGASQMREPFLIALGAVAFWALTTWKNKKLIATTVFVLSMLLMLFLSALIMIASLAFFLGWFWLEYLVPRSRRWLVLGQVGMVLAGIVVVAFGGRWLIASSEWDMLLTEQGSGWIQKIIEEAGALWRVPIITAYGLAQQVLPAALATPAIAVWKAIVIPRALGWYALAPLLMYSVFVVWKIKDRQERRVILWMLLFSLIWLVVASARAGGDQWDNPRYRIAFLPSLSFMAAWAICWAKIRNDAWLWRWLVVECIFLGFFTNWYFSRYFNWWNRLPFWKNVMWIVILSALVIGGGLIWDVSRAVIHKKDTNAD